MRKNLTYLLMTCMVFALGIGAGRLTSTNTSIEDDSGQDQISSLNQQLQQRNSEITALKQKITSLDNAIKQTQTTETGIKVAAEQSQANQSLPAIENEQIAIEVATLETTETLNALQRMTDNPELFDDELAGSLQQRLYKKLDSDPMATRQILDTFIRSPDSDMGQMLSAVLGLFKDAEIESTAMQLASNGTDAEQRIAGLSLLQRLDIDNQASRQVVLNIIESETDTNVLNAALYALKPSIVSAQESQQVLNVLNRHLSSSDPETRRRSVIAYASWATNANATQPIVNALYDDSVDVRAGAAFALGRSKHRSSNIRDALIGKIDDSNEDWTVRDQAWQAVQAFELDDNAHRVFTQFKKQRDQLAEGSSG